MAEQTVQNKIPSLWPFDDLPEGIKKWLQSETVQGIISKLNENLKIVPQKTKVIPFTVTWLIIKTITPEEFTAILGDELEWPIEKTKELASTIKERVLRPIANGLRAELKIDIEKIDTGGAKAIDIPLPAVQQAQTIRLERPIARPTTATPVTDALIGQKPTAPAPTVSTPKKPFMLHEEKPAVAPVAAERQKFSFFSSRQSNQPEPKPAEAPVNVKFGTTYEEKSSNRVVLSASIPKATQMPPAPQKPTPPVPKPATQPDGGAKVVHYTQFKTMLPDKDVHEKDLGNKK